MAAPRLTLRCLGTLSVTRGDVPVALPKSQKTRALLAYLAVTQRPQQRDRLARMFWERTDDPRGALRWSLSKLRTLDDGATRIRADRQRVAFEPVGATVDASDVRAAAQALDELPAERLRALDALFRGEFLDGLELPDCEEFQAWRVALREEFRQLHARPAFARFLREMHEFLASPPERGAKRRGRLSIAP